ncbi:hypothetical protein ASG35_08135 [Burkholderia sp. Leaf177]|uniref:hypothetical protein n=1 Tax=Burkholderia sp. Leaf177 TaxID=1736287 RepID=UPI0006FAA933|nr:hypothetical protein [Burkholderia sp. Leaf177]KQR78408.1 hypothetical protein ASG35_08135 [Burkholderia sp. Leaf177]
MITTRSGKVLITTAVKSKGFNVRGRAADARPTNVFFSANARKIAVAQEHHVTVRNQAVTLADAYAIEQQLNNGINGAYLLIGYGEDWLYFGKTPLDMLGPRPVAKAPKSRPSFPGPPNTDLIRIVAQYDGPATNGDTSQNRDTVMGDSARNYAASCYGDDWANARTWEWLHIRAHSLGGDNAVGNLVAGTFDANTKMIPFERLVQKRSQDASAADPVIVEWDIDVYPDSWVAIGIKMVVKYKDVNDQLVVQSADFNAQSDMNIDKLQYDILGMN